MALRFGTLMERQADIDLNSCKKSDSHSSLIIKTGRSNSNKQNVLPNDRPKAALLDSTDSSLSFVNNRNIIKNEQNSKELDDVKLEDGHQANAEVHRLKNLPYGQVDVENPGSRPWVTGGNLFKGEKRPGDSKLRTKQRTTLREEIALSDQFEKKVPNYFTRKNIDLMRIVEDQVRIFFVWLHIINSNMS